MKGASLRLGDLRAAKLVQAELIGADLERALLGGADLTQANLSGADLTKAWLVDTIRLEATLLHARLASAKLSWTYMPGVNWWDAHDADISSAVTEAELPTTARFRAPSPGAGSPAEC